MDNPKKGFMKKPFIKTSLQILNTWLLTVKEQSIMKMQ
jgi:hypothetical protein